jgi:methylated-DNA-[protein]-cysteine S-methyltransferase
MSRRGAPARSTPMTTIWTEQDSPLGPLTLTSDGRALTGLYMSEHRHRPPLPPGAVRDDEDAALATAAAQVREYLAGERRTFSLELAAAGTPFQHEVWDALTTIPYGETVTYGELARRVGRPGAARAVGLANGRNPISIVVPCHRVVGADGTLTGYGGGLERKRELLALETRPRASG